MKTLKNILIFLGISTIAVPIIYYGILYGSAILMTIIMMNGGE